MFGVVQGFGQHELSSLLEDRDQLTHASVQALRICQPLAPEDSLANHSNRSLSFASGLNSFLQVNQRAQKTDAGQLSRNLLLAPKATVNVKPNLQIIADDVKCTHGCTVSDLSEEEVFYFR